MRFIKAETSGKISIVNLDGNDCRELARSIGARLVQYVRIKAEDFTMICDEEGLLKTGNVCNPAASILYGVLEHGNPIVGDVLFAKNNLDPAPYENDFIDINTKDAAQIAECLQSMIDVIDKAGASQQLHRQYDSSEAPMPEIVFFD